MLSVRNEWWLIFFFFFSSRRRHTRLVSDWSSDVCSSDLRPRWTNFGPRIGFAFQINPKTVLRAGYGFFYSPENDGREDILTKNYPFAIQETFNTGGTGTMYNGPRSEERRVGKECRLRRWQ